MSSYATVEELAAYWRPLTESEQERAEILLENVSSEIRLYAKGLGLDFDTMVQADDDLNTVTKSVVMDAVARILNQSTTDEAVSQFSQSAMGYTASGTYLVPGGGSLVLKRDLKRLGLKRQRYGSLEVFDVSN
jgi:hypothetical protein